MNPSLNRRHFLKNGTALALAYPLASQFGMLGHLLSSNIAMAADFSGPTLVHFVIIDKVQPALFQVVPGDIPGGAAAQNGIAQQASNFRNMNLTKLFGDALDGLPDNVSLNLNNAWESGNGGHSLAASNVSPALGSVNYAFEKLSGGTGLLGAVGFSVGSSAQNSADAFLAPGGIRMKTFTGASQLANTLKNSTAPIMRGGTANTLVKEFDQLASKDTSFRDELTSLAAKISNAVPELEAASSLTDPISQQVASIIALSKAGVCRNFMIGIPYNDTNAGGDLTAGGGQYRLDPFSTTPVIAKAIVELHKAIPNLVCVSTSDGGRSLQNGDVGPGFAFMTGPSDTVKNAIIGPKYTSSNQLGTNFGSVAMSDGTTGIARPSEWYGTALRALKIANDNKFVPEALV